MSKQVSNRFPLMENVKEDDWYNDQRHCKEDGKEDDTKHCDSSSQQWPSYNVKEEIYIVFIHIFNSLNYFSLFVK